jgi:hypothetical protein
VVDMVLGHVRSVLSYGPGASPEAGPHLEAKPVARVAEAALTSR